jgi:hypothetical protein
VAAAQRLRSGKKSDGVRRGRGGERWDARSGGGASWLGRRPGMEEGDAGLCWAFEAWLGGYFSICLILCLFCLFNGLRVNFGT